MSRNFERKRFEGKRAETKMAGIPRRKRVGMVIRESSGRRGKKHRLGMGGDRKVWR